MKESEFEQAIKELGYWKFYDDFRSTYLQVTKIIAWDHFVGELEPLMQSKPCRDAVKVIQQACREFNTKGWFEFEPENSQVEEEVNFNIHAVEGNQ